MDRGVDRGNEAIKEEEEDTLDGPVDRGYKYARHSST